MWNRKKGEAQAELMKARALYSNNGQLRLTLVGGDGS